MKLKIVNKSRFDLPKYATPQSAGLDLRANIPDSIILSPMQRYCVPTGLHIELPEGYEAQIRPRSGMALKHGITVLNAPGTIDADYRGDIGVILINLSDYAYMINPGDKIAQMVISRYEQSELIEVTELTDTERGEGGFGHSGK